MRLCLLLCLLAAPVAHALDAADRRAAEQLRESALRDNRAAALVESLVATAPYRFAGSDNAAKSVDWALKALRDAGLQNVRAEPVMEPHWVRGCASRSTTAAAPNARPGMAGQGVENTSAVSPGTALPGCPGGDVVVTLVGQPPRPLVAVALGGSVATPAEGITAPVIMFGSIDEMKAAPLADIKGKIVFFNRRMERHRDGSGYGAAVSVRSRGPAEAGRRGAVAVVIRSIGTNHDRVPHTGTTRYDEAAPRIPAAALSAVDADLLEEALRSGPAPSLHLHLSSRDLGLRRGANVVGEIPGETDEIVLLAAHLDSWDITPGANDDGAGVAIVIEAARAILAAGLRPRRTVRVFLAANEEFGLSGAKAYARAHAAQIPRHVLALEADFGSGAVHTLNADVPDAEWPRIARFAELLKPLGVALGKDGDEGGSDLNPLHQRGVPVLSPRQDGTRYFDLHHTAADTVETLDRAGLAQNVAVYAVLAWLGSQSEAFGRLPLTAAD